MKFVCSGSILGVNLVCFDAGMGELVLSAEQVGQFRDDGWLLVEGIWPTDLMERACEHMAVQAPNRATGDPEPPDSAFYYGANSRRFPF